MLSIKEAEKQVVQMKDVETNLVSLGLNFTNIHELIIKGAKMDTKNVFLNDCMLP